MSIFHHHPDGIIRVKGETGEYIDTVSNFLIDYGKPYSGPGEGKTVRYYTPGGTHFVSDGNNETFLDPTWPEGDAIIQALSDLLVAQNTRRHPEPPPLTLDEVKAKKRVAVLAEFAALDVYIPRGIEDMWAAMGFDTTTLPEIQQQRLSQKAALRAAFCDIEAATSIAGVEAITW